MFLIAMLMIDHFMNKGNTDITAEMPKATYPLVYVMEGDTRINCLHGYDQEMDCSQLDDTISPLQKDDRKISLQIDLYADSISALAYEVRSADGQRLVEDTEAGSFTESEDMAYVDLVLKDLLEENTEYSFCLKLTDTEGRTIYYYTRIVLADAAYHVSDMTAFALDFHSRSFDKDRAQELTKYLESNADGDNTTYSKVTIHSSFAQITWGDLSVKEETEPEVYVRRINPYVANVELRYALSVDMADGCRYYNVTEYYYIRYTAERMYLLDYERDMDSYFEPEAASYTNNKLSLGISDGNLELAESEDGKSGEKTAAEKELDYAKNYAAKNITRDMEAFSFNTSVARLMEYVNALQKYETAATYDAKFFKACVNDFIVMLAPFTPHFAEELWEMTGHKTSVFDEHYPVADESALVRDETEYAVQINSKIKAKMMIAKNLTNEEIQSAVCADPQIAPLLEGKTVKKCIVVPNRLVNLIVG